MRKLALIMLFAIILCKSVYADDLLHYFDTSGIEASVEKNSNINFSDYLTILYQEMLAK